MNRQLSFLKRALPDKEGGQVALLWLLPLLFLLFFFYRPLLAVFRLLFSPEYASTWQHFNWIQLTRPLLFSLAEASLSTIFTLALGLPAAWLFTRYDFPGRKLLYSLCQLPFILPAVVVAVAFNTILGAQGWLNLAWQALFGAEAVLIKSLGAWAIIPAHVFYNTSIVIRLVSTAWGRINPQLDEASRVLGANPRQSFWETSFPFLRVPIASSALLVFLLDFCSFGIVLILGGGQVATLELAIYQQAMQRFNLPIAGLLALVQLLISLLLVLAQNFITQKNSGKATLSREGLLRKKPTGRRQHLFVFIMVTLLLLVIVTPLLALLSRSLFSFSSTAEGLLRGGFSLRYFRALFVNENNSYFYSSPLRAIGNSLLFALISMLIVGLMGVLASYAIARGGRKLRFLESLLALPLGGSAVSMGLGLLLVYQGTQLLQGNYPLLIPIAHALIALPFAVRTLLPALRGIPNTLREASRCLGAAPHQVFRQIDLPLLLRPFLVSLVFSFTLSLGEFGATGFLSKAQSPTISVSIYRYLSQAGALNYGRALAMAVLLMLLCAGGSFLIESLRLPGEDLY